MGGTSLKRFQIGELVWGWDSLQEKGVKGAAKQKSKKHGKAFDMASHMTNSPWVVDDKLGITRKGSGNPRIGYELMHTGGDVGGTALKRSRK